jgi:hypothetical protein
MEERPGTAFASRALMREAGTGTAAASARDKGRH